MILGLGSDLSDIRRIQASLDRFGDRFRHRVFTELERARSERKADAAVFGVPHEDLGEEVKAVVQLMPGIEPGPEVAAELIAFCRQHLAGLKCPRSVDFEAELPRLPTGKLYKRVLRDRYWGDRKSRIV